MDSRNVTRVEAHTPIPIDVRIDRLIDRSIEHYRRAPAKERQALLGFLRLRLSGGKV